MSESISDAHVEKVIHEYRRTAVLLHPRYPPHAGPPCNSRFGGLPTLPADDEWPRTAEGTPLHFFAQIDCAEITFPTALPDRGVLFFFGRDEGEQIWDDGADDCRVLYAVDAVAGTPPREPPADLMPVGGMFNSHWRDYLREGEAGPNFHVAWPLELLPIDTWPDILFDFCYDDDEQGQGAERRWRSRTETWKQEKEQGTRYNARIQQLREDAYTRATGERPDVEPKEIVAESRACKAMFTHAEEGPEAYPQHWIVIHYAARALLHRQGRGRVVEAEIDSAAEEWLRRSEDGGVDRAVAEEDRRAFRGWLRSLGEARDDSGLGHTATDLVLKSLVATIRAWAGDAVRAARVAPYVYDALRFYFALPRDPGVHFSQMLGHAPSAQNPLDPGESTLCLLNLASNRGIGWSFGDAGYCTFFVEPDDLAAREFSGAWGTIEGY